MHSAPDCDARLCGVFEEYLVGHLSDEELRRRVPGCGWGPTRLAERLDLYRSDFWRKWSGRRLDIDDLSRDHILSLFGITAAARSAALAALLDKVEQPPFGEGRWTTREAMLFELAEVMDRGHSAANLMAALRLVSGFDSTPEDSSLERPVRSLGLSQDDWDSAMDVLSGWLGGLPPWWRERIDWS